MHYYTSILSIILLCSSSIHATPMPTSSPTSAPTLCVLESGKTTCEDRGSCSDAILCTEEVLCTGYQACANSFISTKTLHFSGPAQYISTSLSDGHVLDVLECHGPYNLVRQSVRLARENYVYGPGCMSDTIVHTTGIPNVKAEFRGRGSFHGSTFTCSTGSTCEVVCAGCIDATFIVEPGAHFSLDCKFSASCARAVVQHYGKTLCTTGDGAERVAINPSNRRLLQTNSSPDAVSAKIETLLTVNDPRTLSTSVLCGESNECSNEEYTVQNMACYGSNSCQNVVANSDTFTCQGSGSCTNANVEITHGIIGGYNTANNARVNFARGLSIEGPFSANKSLIRGLGETNSVIVAAYKSFQNSLFMCSSGSCNLICDMGSCNGVTFDCSAVGEEDCELSCIEGCSDDEATVIPSCSVNESKSDCSKNKFCGWFDDTCVAKQVLCSSESTKSDCSAKSKYCKWINGDKKCVLKKKSMPKLYKSFNLLNEF